MRAALNDPNLFAHPTGGLIGKSWAAWRIMLIAIVGERLTDYERGTFKALTGREREPGEPVEEFRGIIGRRSGKTRAMAVLAAWIAALCDHSDILAPGERAVVPLVSASKQQAGKALQYLNGLFDHIPILAAMVEGRTDEKISLSNGVDIESAAASFRTIRGGTAVAILGDEIAFWRNETSANPDTEILGAARPMLLTTGGPLICISSPYARRGELWNAFRQNYGSQGDKLILVARAASRVVNPGLSEKKIQRAYELDPAKASAEYGAEFRIDIESFVRREVIDAATIPGRLELPPLAGVSYRGFVDPSGGAQDSMTLGIAHAEGDTVVLDAVREVKPPFSPDAVVEEFVALLSAYQLTEVTGDRWGGGFVSQQFEKRGVTYTVSERAKSDIYKELLPLLNSRRVEILDIPRLAAQLAGLECRTARGGRDSIDHAPNAHDDVINAAAGSIVLVSGIGSKDVDLDLYIKAYGGPGVLRPGLGY